MIRGTAPHATMNQTWAEVDAAQEGDSISSGAARCIASWWASPARGGLAFQALAEGLPVSYRDVSADIAHVLRHDGPSERGMKALRLLRQWAAEQQEV